MIILTGNSNIKFAEALANRLYNNLTECKITRFSNGEIRINTIADSLRGQHVYIICSHSNNINEDIMETLLLAHSAHYASAKTITLVVPSYPYARQDRKTKSRDPISARFFADLCASQHITHMITVDLHNGAIQGFSSFPADNLTAIHLFAKYINNKIIPDNLELSKEQFVIVSPDAGGMKRAKDLANELKLDTAVMYKERSDASKIDTMKLLGDVNNKVAIIVDDMADTCGTLKKASELLVDNGANKVYAMVTHGILSGNALKNINESKIEQMIVTNSVNLGDKPFKCKKLKILDIVPLIAGCIHKNYTNSSTQSLFVRGGSSPINMVDNYGIVYYDSDNENTSDSENEKYPKLNKKEQKIGELVKNIINK